MLFNYNTRIRLISGLFFSILPVLPTGAEQSITIDPDLTFQTIEGFGTSGAWWGPRVGDWPADRRRSLLQLLYDPNHGAGLTIHRYHIGAGGGEELLDDWRRVPCIEVAPGIYDVNRDPGIRIAQEAVAAGAEAVVVFACSPPSRLTVSGKVVADKEQNECNLAPENYRAYADYLCDIVSLLQHQKGLPLERFSPVNEPQWEWNGNTGEGLHFKPAELVAFLKVFCAQAQQRLPDLEIEVFDSGAWSHTVAYLEPILADPDLNAAIDSFSVHSYWSTDEHRHAFKQWAESYRFDRPLHMTEWCEMKWGRSPGMESACILASTVVSDLTICDVRSWCSWEGASTFDYRDALITVNEDGSSISTNKRLWALANFARFIRPGAARVQAVGPQDLPVVCARNQKGADLVCVVVNPGDRERSLQLKLTSPQPPTIIEQWETSAQRDLEQVRKRQRPGTVTIPPRSVTTLLLAP